MRAIFILADSVSRSFLPAYGNQWVKTPNLDRLAARSTVFDSHWCGSAPCMPARRDFFTGRLNFLERPWGGVEPYDVLFPNVLREQAQVYSHMVTDHMNYFIPGGENYIWAFDGYCFERGQEHDNYCSVSDKWTVPPHRGVYTEQYYKNRSLFREEKDFPSPRTFQSAIDWLDENHQADNFLLWVESFDPHEPFDTPQNYLDLYEDDYTGLPYFWPEYAPISDQTPEELSHLRKRYAATLSMMDAWLGKLLDKLDSYELWEDTLVIFTTDHGFMLGEHGYLAKNYMPAYNEVMRLPLMVYHPQVPAQRLSAITQGIDFMPTLLDWFGVSETCLPNPLHGRSLLPLLRGERDTNHDVAVYGYFGRSVNLTDGEYTYFRAPAQEDNKPLNLYVGLPTTLRQNMGGNEFTHPERVTLGKLIWNDQPLYKIPASCFHFLNDSLDFTARGPYNDRNLLFNLIEDPEQMHAIEDPKREAVMIDKLSQALTDLQAPSEQWERLGIAKPMDRRSEDASPRCSD